MSEYQNVVNALNKLGSKEWINQYFNLVKKVLTELQIGKDDPRLSMSLSEVGHMPVNLGQRYILHPYQDEHIGCIVPLEFKHHDVSGNIRFTFRKRKVADAKYLCVPFPTNSKLPDHLYNACIDECLRILQRSKKTSFLKFNVPLLYDFTMDSVARAEIMHDLITNDEN